MVLNKRRLLQKKMLIQKYLVLVSDLSKGNSYICGGQTGRLLRFETLLLENLFG